MALKVKAVERLLALRFLKNSLLWYQQGGIAVAEEAEVVSEGVVVDLVPVALDEGAVTPCLSPCDVTPKTMNI